MNINKKYLSKEFDLCHYWYFNDIDFKYEPYLYNDCFDLMQKAMNFNDVAIASVKGSDYKIHFLYMSKDDAINIMKNSKKWVIINFFYYISNWMKQLIIKNPEK